MARLIFFVIVGAIGLVIVAVKRVTGEVTGNENLKKASLHSETKVVMDKTAKGINWMEEQWEQSKRTAEGINKNKASSAESVGRGVPPQSELDFQAA